jgi:ribosome modulation factor
LQLLPKSSAITVGSTLGFAGAIFLAGYAAGVVGAARATNPHKPDTDDALFWFDGWDHGDAKRTLNTAKEEP